MYQTGHNATANIGTYNDVQGNQTINTGLSQEQGNTITLNDLYPSY